MNTEVNYTSDYKVLTLSVKVLYSYINYQLNKQLDYEMSILSGHDLPLRGLLLKPELLLIARE